MKKISAVIPCYNDSNSIMRMQERLTCVFRDRLPQYDYEIIFVDDCSPDDTWTEIKKACATDRRAKGIRNATNFGFVRNVFSSMKYGDGDAVFMLFGDIQDPPEILPEFINFWEEGCNVVIGQKSKTNEGAIITLMRKLYYKIIDKFSSGKQISNFNGFGLYDRSFIDLLDQIEDMQPFIKGIVSEFANKIKIVSYEQAMSERKSNNNFLKNYDLAMVGITSYTKMLMRFATFSGCVMGILSFILAAVVFIRKLSDWDTYPIGIPSIGVGVFFLGAIQLFFLGILGEYVLSINERSMKRPLVVIGERLNFEDDTATDMANK
jgi:glycosyltransferase involved in cell wall biosynthesis